MPYKALSDIDPFANYQKTLKVALGLAKAKVLTVTLYEKFPFKEQTAPLLVVGTLENPLLKTIHEKGATKKGEGKCTFTPDGQMLVKGSSALSKPTLENALKIAKIPLTVRRIEGDGDLEKIAKWELQNRGKTPATDATNKVQGDAKEEIKAKYPLLIHQFEAALKKLVGIDDEAKVKAWKTRLEQEFKDGDYLQVKLLMPAMRTDFAGVEARIAERERQQKEYEAKRGPIRLRSDKAHDTGSPQDQKQLTVAWAQAKQAADKHSYAAAIAKLKEIETLIPKILARTLQAGREGLAELQGQAKELLDNPIQKETETLEKEGAAVEAELKNGNFAAAQKALDRFEGAIEQLVNARREKKLAEELMLKARILHQNHQYDIADDKKAKFQKAVDSDLESYKKSGNWKGAIALATKTVGELESHLTQVFKTNQAKTAALQEANKAFRAALNQGKAEDEAAETFGNGRFTSGMLKDIWKAVKGAHTASPANGAIGGVYTLADVEAAIATWRSVGNSGTLTNFHVPGRRPQAKWEKDFTRPAVQANFCCFWRNRKVNIHVDVDPVSYFHEYGDEVDWTLVPKSVREHLKH
ncbi:MAG TPA: hypothetical protein VGL72_31700 [Bryobacteraceae bacterium]